MNNIYKVKGWLKTIRWRARRASATLKWGADRLSESPIVLGNAMPKSGSHLIIQVLQGLVQLGPFIDPGFPPVNRSEDNNKLSQDAVMHNLRRMRPGDIGYGYLWSHEPFISELTKPERATVFVYRDPRDMVISHVYYATTMHPGHGMHRYYTKTLNTMEERINAAIEGVEEPGSELSPIHQKYTNYLGWLNQPEILCLRFEDLILNQDRSLGTLWDYLQIRGYSPTTDRSKAIEYLKNAIVPRKSGTYRKGKPGNWREYFTEANKEKFKETSADLLVSLNYETDNDW